MPSAPEHPDLPASARVPGADLADQARRVAGCLAEHAVTTILATHADRTTPHHARRCDLPRELREACPATTFRAMGHALAFERTREGLLVLAPSRDELARWLEALEAAG